jgi:MerR family redox-sensitive transcriptional activator SoxR
MNPRDLLTIGEVSQRSGIAASALRYYETMGLIASTRTSGDRRRYRRSVLRRLAVVRAAQQVGLTLEQIVEAFRGIDSELAPTRRQWARMAAAWQPLLDQRIAELHQVRDNLSNCVGCGCLSMKQCALYNPRDVLAESGSGARRMFPEPPELS